jgi:hypothetical protein
MKLSVLFLGLILFLAPVLAVAQSGEPGYEGTISDTTSAAGFNSSYFYTTDSQGRGIAAKYALIVVETASILFTEDGTTPTVAAGTNIGTRMDAGQSYILIGIKAVSNFKCINRVASSGAVVKYRIFY